MNEQVFSVIGRFDESIAFTFIPKQNCPFLPAATLAFAAVVAVVIALSIVVSSVSPIQTAVVTEFVVREFRMKFDIHCS